MLDLLLVNPNNRIQGEFSGIEPPLWAGLIASHFRSWGDKVEILDAEALDLSVGSTVAQIKALNPKQVIIVVMGNNPSASSTPKMPVTKAIIDGLGYRMGIAVTGLHPSALPEQTKLELGVEVLKGMVFDGTPSQPWDLLPMDKYRAHNWHCLDGSPRTPYTSIYTSLGCPFTCDFCNIHALYGDHQVRFRDPKDVIKEIDLLVNKYHVRNIKFWDELFTLDSNHVLNICNPLIDRDYDLNIWAYARVDRVNEALLNIMRKAGIRWLGYGFESANDTVLNQSHKRANRQQAIDAVSMTHRADISINGNFIFGLPGDTEETMRENLEFAKSLELEYVNFYTAMPYPGSELYKRNPVNRDWSSYSQFGTNREDAATQFKDHAFREYFTDPGYLKRIGGKFGIQAVTHIERMLEGGKPRHTKIT